MNMRRSFRHSRTLLLVSFLMASATAPVLAQTWPPAPFSEATLYSFTGGADGGGPSYVTLLADDRGALYGTTGGGGAGGSGTVFKLTPPAPGKSQWTETVLYSFSGADGAGPSAGLVADPSGALYGATSGGGNDNNGVAFKLTPPLQPSQPWTYTQIYTFPPTYPTTTPSGAAVLDGAGALIGSVITGGAYGLGAIYKLTPPASSGGQWTGAILYSFTGGADGSNAWTTLLVDSSGAIYGTTTLGGAGDKGVIFKLTPPGPDCTPISPNLWCETVLHAFNGSDGARPRSGLTRDSSGMFYGTTTAGGAAGNGAVYSLAPPVPPSTQWQYTVLYSFDGGGDGAAPYAPPTLKGGYLYGATSAGGGTGCGGAGCGTLFELRPPAAPSSPYWTENILYRFSGAADGAFAGGGPTFNALHFGSGLAIYGVTSQGGASGKGTVFTLQCAKAVREVFGGGLHAACGQ
ncbi:choice-of-anchor tandem repeat GloVer-containing protein [Methylocystis heyeri]|uniref:Uncharacterized protein n=1 Tax=Methylocystis heyeri TaxID=391905 RepID=A0A6B8KEC6_9HYPH|nr:choice-of-anchor tandem repeat GloVer-containing protein [Methylocystis heyeri]QGM44918.1 hypothetical protein H2LOC_004015 [Methylocystis heyeri]